MAEQKSSTLKTLGALSKLKQPFTYQHAADSMKLRADHIRKKVKGYAASGFLTVEYKEVTVNVSETDRTKATIRKVRMAYFTVTKKCLDIFQSSGNVDKIKPWRMVPNSVFDLARCL